MSEHQGWIGVDLDGTLAEYDGWQGIDHIGAPEREESVHVIRCIQGWLLNNGLPALKVTCFKDFGMVELWDDRAVQVIPNTSLRADGQ